jgi:hypothetical protein
MFFGLKLQSSSSSSSGKWIPYVPPPEDNFSCHVSQVRRFFFQSVLFCSLSLLFFLFLRVRDWKNTHSPPPADALFYILKSALNIKLSLSLSLDETITIIKQTDRFNETSESWRTRVRENPNGNRRSRVSWDRSDDGKY